MPERVSPAFPFPSHSVEVLGSRMHYVEAGSGDPILLLHGNPTSAYLWRNVIPPLTRAGRCIAPDLIGMGRSDKPDIAYRVFDHAAYVAGFIEALGLERLTLVLHDWGGFCGFHYAARHAANVRAIAFMETIVRPLPWEALAGPTASLFRMLRSEEGQERILAENFFVERVLPGSVRRKLGEAEMTRYREPFGDRAARKPTAVFPREIPFDGDPADVARAVEDYGAALAEGRIPLLLLAFTPGALMGPAEVAWCRERFPTLTVREMGEGIHFVQEDQPAAIGEAIARWLATL